MEVSTFCCGNLCKGGMDPPVTGDVASLSLGRVYLYSPLTCRPIQWWRTAHPTSCCSRPHECYTRSIAYSGSTHQRHVRPPSLSLQSNKVVISRARALRGWCTEYWSDASIGPTRHPDIRNTSHELYSCDIICETWLQLHCGGSAKTSPLGLTIAISLYYSNQVSIAVTYIWAKRATTQDRLTN